MRTLAALSVVPLAEDRGPSIRAGPSVRSSVHERLDLA